MGSRGFTTSTVPVLVLMLVPWGGFPIIDTVAMLKRQASSVGLSYRVLVQSTIHNPQSTCIASWAASSSSRKKRR